MTTIALLRGINVGGHRKVRMAPLREALDDAGLGPTRTYVQSGNLVVTGGATAATSQIIESVLAAEFELDDVPVLLRTHGELVDLVASNPFAEATTQDPRMVHVVFLDGPATDGAALDPDRSPHDRVHLDGQHLWIHYGRGASDTKLSPAWIQRTLGVAGTARNMNTVTKLIEMSTAGT